MWFLPLWQESHSAEASFLVFIWIIVSKLGMHLIGCKNCRNVCRTIDLVPQYTVQYLLEEQALKQKRWTVFIWLCFYMSGLLDNVIQQHLFRSESCFSYGPRSKACGGCVNNCKMFCKMAQKGRSHWNWSHNLKKKWYITFVCLV